jgi:type I restriction enzyme R subunit
LTRWANLTSCKHWCAACWHPQYLLDYLRYFVLFEDDGGMVKKIAGYHQFHAVRLAIGQVVAASRPGGTQKGGVVWHTQGSGKSITMTCFAARVMQEPEMENPTIVVITDRNDLDGQLFGVFSLAQDLLREQPVQARTRQELRALLATVLRAALCLPPSRSSCRGKMRICSRCSRTGTTLW